MTVLRGFLITLASGVAFSSLGAGVGYLIGSLAPDFYRTVFLVPPENSIQSTQLGIVLGLTQGFVTGVIVGLVLVVTVAWYNSRVIAISSISRQPIAE